MPTKPYHDPEKRHCDKKLSLFLPFTLVPVPSILAFGLRITYQTTSPPAPDKPFVGLPKAGEPEYGSFGKRDALPMRMRVVEGNARFT